MRQVHIYRNPYFLSRKPTQEIPMSIEDTIKEQIKNNPIIIYMKGNPNAPQCGFSARSCQILMACGEKFA